MPDDQNVPVGGAGQTKFIRIKFASDTVREKAGDLLAEAGGNLTASDILNGTNANYSGGQDGDAIPQAAFSTLDGGGRGRDYLIGSENADVFIVDIGTDSTKINADSPKRGRLDAADIIVGFDQSDRTAGGQNGDKIQLRIRTKADEATFDLKYDDRYDATGDGRLDTIIRYDDGKIVAILSDVTGITLAASDFTGLGVGSIAKENLQEATLPERVTFLAGVATSYRTGEDGVLEHFWIHGASTPLEIIDNFNRAEGDQIYLENASGYAESDGTIKLSWQRTNALTDDTDNEIKVSNKYGHLFTIDDGFELTVDNFATGNVTLTEIEIV